MKYNYKCNSDKEDSYSNFSNPPVPNCSTNTRASRTPNPHSIRIAWVMRRKERSFLSHAYAGELIRGGRAHVTSRPYLRSTQAYYFTAYACNGSAKEKRAHGGSRGPETGREPRARSYKGPHCNSGSTTAKTQGFRKARSKSKLSSEILRRGFEKGVVLFLPILFLSLSLSV